MLRVPQRAIAMEVPPRVFIDNAASKVCSVIEVNGHDRPMREDLDRLLSAVETLREAVDDEKSLRREQIHELRADIDSRFASLRQQISSLP